MELNQLILAQSSATVVQPHQFRDSVLTEGPTSLPRFRAHKWCFQVRGNNSVRLTFHQFDNEQHKRSVITELEHFLRTALQQIIQDGARMTDIIHMYLKCDGLDFDFAFNPSGVHALRLSDLMSGTGLERILERFSAMIQSGKDIFLDNKTSLTVYSFTPIEAGVNPMDLSTTKCEFVQRSGSIVEIKNTEDQTCFARCLVLGLAKCGRWGEVQYNKIRKVSKIKKANKTLVQKAYEIHQSVGLNINQPVTTKEMELLADEWQIQIHCFDINGVNPDFSYHSPKRNYGDHLFILQDNNHFHFISKINAVLKHLRRSNLVEFCYDCFGIKFSNRRLTCSEDDDTDTTRYQIGDRSLAYFPDRGEDRVIGEQFIQPTEPKDELKARIIYLDFETYVRGKHVVTGEIEPCIPIEDLPVPMLIDYEPYEFLERRLDTTEYCYTQTINHCEAQYEDGTVFTFSNIKDTMEWLGLPRHTGSIVIAHCGGSFDFQMILRYFLSDAVLRMKKVKAPLMRGNKIVTAVINNDLKLVDSYAFVAHALSKFPAIFNIAEEKKGFFPHTFNRPEFWDYIGPIPHWRYYEPDNFHPSKREEFFQWYDEQVSNKVVFDFKTEMIAYCHSDVQLLRIGMTKFRDIFKNLQDENGRSIGVDPYHHLTIAGVAFEGIYCKYFLPSDMIGVVP